MIRIIEPDRVERVLVARNIAAESEAGQAAAALAQLDWASSQVALDAEQTFIREELYKALDTFHKAQTDLNKHLANVQLKAKLEIAMRYLSDLIKPPQQTAMRFGRSQIFRDPIFPLAEQWLTRKSRDTSANQADLTLVRSLIEANDSEGLRVFMGA